LTQTWQTLSPKKVVVSCIEKTDLVSCITSVANELWQNITLHYIKTAAEGFGIINGYANPPKLGVDRWLALVAARAKIQDAVCVVDSGTAMTIDLLNAQGIHQGGLICPGLMLMQTALNNTAHLPFVEYPCSSTQTIIAKNTENAIAYGTLYANCSLIERVVAEQSSIIHLILTGGDAITLSQHLRCAFSIEPNLILEGLAIVSTQ
jgi:type III pantothenate kinase